MRSDWAAWVTANTRGELGTVVRWLDSVSSTMDEAADWARAGAAHGSVVVAESQTEGRGSRGQVWSSPPGEDLYFTVILRVDVPPPRRPPLTLAVGVAIADVVEHETGAHVGVKWPNDVIVDGWKCAGVLVESRDDSLLVGVGLNVNRRWADAAVRDEVVRNATSLAELCQHSFERATVLARALDTIDARIREQLERGPEATVARLAPRLLFVGKRVSCGGRQGILRRVDAGGALVIEDDEGTEVRCVTGPLRRALP